MVQMGVGEHHGGQLVRPERKGAPVAGFEFLAALVHAAVDEDLSIPPGQVGATAGDHSAGAVEGYGGHGASSGAILAPAVRAFRHQVSTPGCSGGTISAKRTW